MSCELIGWCRGPSDVFYLLIFVALYLMYVLLNADVGRPKPNPIPGLIEIQTQTIFRHQAELRLRLSRIEETLGIDITKEVRVKTIKERIDIMKKKFKEHYAIINNDWATRYFESTALSSQIRSNAK